MVLILIGGIKKEIDVEWYYLFMTNIYDFACSKLDMDLELEVCKHVIA